MKKPLCGKNQSVVDFLLKCVLYTVSTRDGRWRTESVFDPLSSVYCSHLNQWRQTIEGSYDSPSHSSRVMPACRSRRVKNPTPISPSCGLGMITVMSPRRIHSTSLRTGLRMPSTRVWSLKTQFTHSPHKFAPRHRFQAGHAKISHRLDNLAQVNIRDDRNGQAQT